MPSFASSTWDCDASPLFMELTRPRMRHWQLTLASRMVLHAVAGDHLNWSARHGCSVLGGVISTQLVVEAWMQMQLQEENNLVGTWFIPHSSGQFPLLFLGPLARACSLWSNNCNLDRINTTPSEIHGQYHGRHYSPRRVIDLIRYSEIYSGHTNSRAATRVNRSLLVRPTNRSLPEPRGRVTVTGLSLEGLSASFA